jgi:hypothetical protein
MSSLVSWLLVSATNIALSALPKAPFWRFQICRLATAESFVRFSRAFDHRVRIFEDHALEIILLSGVIAATFLSDAFRASLEFPKTQFVKTMDTVNLSVPRRYGSEVTRAKLAL